MSTTVTSPNQRQGRDSRDSVDDARTQPDLRNMSVSLEAGTGPEAEEPLDIDEHLLMMRQRRVDPVLDTSFSPPAAEVSTTSSAAAHAALGVTMVQGVDAQSNPSPMLSDDTIAALSAAGLRYERILASGGMGVVAVVLDENAASERFPDGRRVVVKLMTEQARNDTHMSARVEEELRALAMCDHPNIVPTLRIGNLVDGQLYVTMPLMEGGTMLDKIRDATANPKLRRQAVLALADIADALDFLDSQLGFVHRDLKPANILFSDNATPYVADLGLAAQTNSPATSRNGTAPPVPIERIPTAVTAQGMIVGTPQYMSPEQVRGERVDGRSDLFALGAILFEVASGRYAFQGDGAFEIFMAITQGSPPNLREANPKVAPQLAEITHKLMSSSPEDRFQRGSEVSAALRAVAAEVRDDLTPKKPWYSLSGLGEIVGNLWAKFRG